MPLLLAVVLLGGLGALLARSGGHSIAGLLRVADDAPTCPARLNRWADQRLVELRIQLQKEHGLYRTDGEAPNAIAAAMHWIDDRIIDQRIGEAAQQIRSSLLKSSRCLVAFQP